MIKNIRHKGLKALYQKGKASGVEQSLLKRLKIRLTVLDSIEKAEDLQAFPNFRLHTLKGNMSGHWSIWVSGNWRLTFRFENGNVLDLDLMDYH